MLVSNFEKIHPVEAKLFHADGLTGGWTGRQTDMMNLIVAFYNFKDTLKSSCH
jgi:hypothetical protein